MTEYVIPTFQQKPSPKLINNKYLTFGCFQKHLVQSVSVNKLSPTTFISHLGIIFSNFWNSFMRHRTCLRTIVRWLCVFAQLKMQRTGCQAFERSIISAVIISRIVIRNSGHRGNFCRRYKQKRDNNRWCLLQKVLSRCHGAGANSSFSSVLQTQIPGEVRTQHVVLVINRVIKFINRDHFYRYFLHLKNLKNKIQKVNQKALTFSIR